MIKSCILMWKKKKKIGIKKSESCPGQTTPPLLVAYPTQIACNPVAYILCCKDARLLKLLRNENIVIGFYDHSQASFLKYREKEFLRSFLLSLFF
jgi:hypothetical protein